MSQKTAVSLSIQEVQTTEAPIKLLLLVAPSENKLHSYLSSSKCFVASSNGAVIGACVVHSLGAGKHELLSIAIQPAHQKSGFGTALLKWVIESVRRSGSGALAVGTGTFGYQLAVYQRRGFRVTRIEHDFFLTPYAEPIFEDGIQLFDMRRLTLKYPDNAASWTPQTFS